MAKTGMIIDGVFGSQAVDSSGEILDVEGADISDLEAGKGVLNYEHKGSDDVKSNGEEIVGKILTAHKVFSREDCQNQRQREYWDNLKLPFIYGIARLYDGAGHDGARALAAQIRDHYANEEPILVRFSVEGSTLQKEGNTLKASVIRRVALTLKPCNKTADSGLLEDPNAPAGFEKNPVKRDPLETTKFEHPGFTRLGGGEVVYRPFEKNEAAALVKTLIKLKALRKATEAGNYNVAPSSLSGGAALGREHLIGLKTKAVRTLKDYSRSHEDFDKTDFRSVLKNQLPEASDDFCDHFADLAEDYHVKIRKAEELSDSDDTGGGDTSFDFGQNAAEAPKKPRKRAVKATPAGKPASKSKKAAAVKPAAKPAKVKATAPAAAPAPKLELGQEPLTIRGKPVGITSSDQKARFDESTGMLHTQRGSFPMYIPSRDSASAAESFHNIMHDPKVNEFHDYAMKNWAKVNQALKAGKLPPEVVMHATLFSQLSPNTPVPMQELMYGHLVDSMKHTGIDARNPNFSSIKDDWMGRDRGDKMPDQSTGHYERLGDQIRIKGKDTTVKDAKGNDILDANGNPMVKRRKGELQSFMLANNKFKNMEQYHTLHNSLVDLVNRHKDDARSGVAELMHHKYKAGLWDAVRKRGMGKGKDDIGPYTAGPAVAGLAPKTARYTYGMMGGGNVHVPDTHFTRYLFGLEKGKDNSTIDYLKTVLWNENNSDVLDGIDRYYAQHHDAVKHMVQHPQYQHLFQGNPENAVFPAFWKNWVGIVPHEQARGMGTAGFNEFTDHKPFWEAIAPHLEKSELDEGMAYHTAKCHARWVSQYGEMPAMMLYYRHLVPKLMGEAEQREQHAPSLVKMELAVMGLQKSVAQVVKARATPAVVDANQHGAPGLTDRPEQKELVHGLDLSRHGKSFMSRPNSNNKKVFIKSDKDGSQSARHEVAYYNAAHDVFGLGHYLPTTAACQHPQDPDHLMTVSAPVPAAERYDAESKNHEHILRHLGSTGELDKLMTMDHVLGNDDRHIMNMMFTFHPGEENKPNLRLIDHGDLAGLSGGKNYLEQPAYMEGYSPEWRTHSVHPTTVDWAKNLDPHKLEHALKHAGLDRHEVDESLRRLIEVKQHLMKHQDKATKGSLFKARQNAED